MPPPVGSLRPLTKSSEAWNASPRTSTASSSSTPIPPTTSPTSEPFSVASESTISNFPLPRPKFVPLPPISWGTPSPLAATAQPRQGRRPHQNAHAHRQEASAFAPGRHQLLRQLPAKPFQTSSPHQRFTRAGRAAIDFTPTMETIVRAIFHELAEPPILAFPCSNAPPNNEIRQINKHFTHWISPHYLSRAIHAAVFLPPSRPERPLLPHHPHHRLDLAPHV